MNIIGKLRLVWRLRAALKGQGPPMANGTIQPPTFAGAAKTNTGIWTTITATLGLVILWIPVLTQHTEITPEMWTETLAVIAAWAALLSARKAVLKIQVNQ